MTDFYHVYISPKKGITAQQVEEKMNLAVDWFRYTPNLWVLYTTLNEDNWQERLRPLVDPDGNMFICRLDIRRHNGWMSKRFWDWIKTKQVPFQR